MVKRTRDLHVESIRPLLPPAILLEELPLSEQASTTVSRAREEIVRILDGLDDRLLVVVGPCSIHDPVAGLDYGRRLKALADVRESVLTIRRAKSMVLESGDPNRRSCGSFFMNPFVTPAEIAAVAARAQDPAMPRWPQPDGRVKLSAAWLIERAGFTRGQRDGTVGLSTRHALAVVAHDGARASDVLAFARRIQTTVEARFGVRLVPEPVVWTRS